MQVVDAGRRRRWGRGRRPGLVVLAPVDAVLRRLAERPDVVAAVDVGQVERVEDARHAAADHRR